MVADLGWPPDAVSSIARGVNNALDVAGNDFSATSSRALLWPDTGGITVLNDCSGSAGHATVHGISANAQVVVGGSQGIGGSVWSPGGCERLPPLPGDTSSTALAVNGDGTVVGGIANASSAPTVPVRWTHVAGQWQVEQLDSRSGAASGANTAGDLAGFVVTPCALPDGCSRAVIWYAAGGSRELATLGGEHSSANDINANGEVVGISTAPQVGETAYFWSESRGMVQLPFKGRPPIANALSDVRADGTRVVVGADGRANAIVWVVRNP
jgi:probable HAF family extracellular repeat protein